MKFGTLTKQKMFYLMMLRSSQPDIVFKVRLKIKLMSIYDLGFDLESNV